ncbi:MAG: hypothetical protein EXR93_04670 [Gemmatimonadetes bacterium]|nr:hypothetical protein [Gemmatimonadota bacterium]
MLHKGRVPAISTFVAPNDAAVLSLTLQARTALGDWLGGYPWDHFVTLTFSSGSPSTEGAIKAFRGWIRRLEQRGQQRISWFYVLETSHGGMRHLHALVLGTAGLPSAALENAWRWGRVDASEYDRRKGASYYVTKWAAFGEADYDFDLPMTTGPVGAHSPEVPLNGFTYAQVP